MIAFLSLLSACLVLRATATEVVLGQPLLADKFESRPRTRVVNSGEEVTLTCQPKLNDFIFQVWSYFDKTEKRPYLVQSSDPQLGFEVKIVPESDPVRSDLIITSVGERQESFYQCVAFNASMMGYYSDPTQVIIFEPANVAFNVPLPNGDVYSTSPGATAVLGLVVSGKPSPALTLQKQVGSEWITVDDERFFINSSVIRIDPVKVGDSARYQLVANNTNVRSLMLMFEIEVEAVGWTSKTVDKALDHKFVPSTVCPKTNCPVPECADPKLEPGSCCPTCSPSSKCFLKGCVQYSEKGLGTSWRRDPCQTCYCIAGHPLCIKTYCPTLDCPASVVVHKKGTCCSYCDYSKLASSQCRVEPDKVVSVTMQGVEARNATGLCTHQIVKHRCSRSTFDYLGHSFVCRELIRVRRETVSDVCGLEEARIAFRDVVRCSARRIAFSIEGHSEEKKDSCQSYFPLRGN